MRLIFLFVDEVVVMRLLEVMERGLLEEGDPWVGGGG